MTHPKVKEMKFIMQKIVIAFALIASTQSVPAHITAIAPTQHEIPAYAKWGQLAMKETRSKYPNASIIDYLHEGSESKGNSTIEKFRLWLKENSKEFEVSVEIEYTTETETLVTIQIQEI